MCISFALLKIYDARNVSVPSSMCYTLYSDYINSGTVQGTRTQKKHPCAIFIVEVIYDFQRSKLTWTDLSMLMDSPYIYVHIFTCNELKMVKSQANTTVFSLTANNPNTQVSPSRGSRITDAFTTYLYIIPHSITV